MSDFSKYCYWREVRRGGMLQHFCLLFGYNLLLIILSTMVGCKDSLPFGDSPEQGRPIRSEEEALAVLTALDDHFRMFEEQLPIGNLHMDFPGKEGSAFITGEKSSETRNLTPDAYARTTTINILVNFDAFAIEEAPITISGLVGFFSSERLATSCHSKRHDCNSIYTDVKTIQTRSAFEAPTFIKVTCQLETGEWISDALRIKATSFASSGQWENAEILTQAGKTFFL